jgi:hypothetical protein
MLSMMHGAPKNWKTLFRASTCFSQNAMFFLEMTWYRHAVKGGGGHENQVRIIGDRGGTFASLASFASLKRSSFK